MAEFIYRDGGDVIHFSTDSHSEDLEWIRKLSSEGRQFTFKKFGKKTHYPQ